MTRAIPPHTRVRATVDGWADRLLSLSHALHAEPETAFEEHASVARLGALLREAGFEVAEGVHGLPTALTATYGSGGPTIGVCAEYDALPGLGHACGHNVICAASAGAAVALRPLADELGFRVKVIGSPAEEEGGGKVLLLQRGAFDDVTVAMMAHPERHDHCRAENSSPPSAASASPSKGGPRTPPPHPNARSTQRTRRSSPRWRSGCSANRWRETAGSRESSPTEARSAISSPRAAPSTTRYGHRPPSSWTDSRSASSTASGARRSPPEPR